MHCFMISICDAESQFDDGKNERYHSLIHYKKLEHLKKTFVYEKLLLLKPPQNTKKASSTAITEKREKRKVWHTPG